MNAPARRIAPQAPLSDLAAAEDHLLNADLAAKRRVLAGTLSREDYAGLRVRFDAALAAVRLEPGQGGPR